MRTAEDFIHEMERSNILMTRERTFREYVSEITQFQNMICRMIAGDEYHEGMRFDEAMFMMDSLARKKALRNHPAVHDGILTMKKLVKDMNITMAGANGENIVSKTLQYLERPNTQIFRNVYITDGIDETELDGIVLTDNGIIILEVKNVKIDLTLTEDGRMVFAGTECYDKVPLAAKMALKRRLLKKCLEAALRERGMDIPVCVDSFIVFSAPKGQYIRIDDRYRKEKHCFRTGLNKKIENYIGYAYYKDDQMKALAEIFSEMEANAKRFESKLDFNEVRRSLGEALAILQDEPAPILNGSANVINFEHPNDHRRKTSRVVAGLGYAAASLFAGLIISGAAVLAVNARRA